MARVVPVGTPVLHGFGHDWDSGATFGHGEDIALGDVDGEGLGPQVGSTTAAVPEEANISIAVIEEHTAPTLTSSMDRFDNFINYPSRDLGIFLP